jgi:DNA-binding NtrC family response regulator
MPEPAARPHVLLVEPDEVARVILRNTALHAGARVESHAGFVTARARPDLGSFDFLVTNIRLEAYNGLHLAYLMTTYGPCRSIAYSTERDPSLAREAQQAGAFYEVAPYLPVTLPAYLHASLPVRDRRDPGGTERRRLFRGGRRRLDIHAAGMRN